MDTIVIVMFGCVLCAMTALNFVELRRIRKKLDRSQSISPPLAGRSHTAA